MSKCDKKNDCRQTIQQHDESYTATCIFISLPLQEKWIDANKVYFFSNVNFCSTFRRDGHGKPPFRAGDLNNATPSSTVPAANPSVDKNAESLREQVVTAAQQLAPTVTMARRKNQKRVEPSIFDREGKRRSRPQAIYHRRKPAESLGRAVTRPEAILHDAWTSLGEVEMSVHGYVAMILGITFSLRGLQAFLWNGSRFRLRLKKLALREGAGLDTDYTCCCASTCPPFCAWNSGRVLSLLKQQGVRI